MNFLPGYFASADPFAWGMGTEHNIPGSVYLGLATIAPRTLAAEYYARLRDPGKYWREIRRMAKYFSHAQLVEEKPKRPVPGHAFGYITGVTDTRSPMEKLREQWSAAMEEARKNWVEELRFGPKTDRSQAAYWKYRRLMGLSNIQFGMKPPPDVFDGPKHDYIFIDEAAHVDAETWRKMMLQSPSNEVPGDVPNMMNDNYPGFDGYIAAIKTQAGVTKYDPVTMDDFFKFATPDGEVSRPTAGDPVTVTLRKEDHYFPHDHIGEAIRRWECVDRHIVSATNEICTGHVWIRIEKPYLDEGKSTYPVTGWQLFVYEKMRFLEIAYADTRFPYNHWLLLINRNPKEPVAIEAGKEILVSPVPFPAGDPDDRRSRYLPFQGLIDAHLALSEAQLHPQRDAETQGGNKP